MSLMLSTMLHVSVQRNLIGHYFAKIFKKIFVLCETFSILCFLHTWICWLGKINTLYYKQNIKAYILLLAQLCLRVRGFRWVIISTNFISKFYFSSLKICHHSKKKTYEDGCEYPSALPHLVPFNLHYGKLDTWVCGLELGSVSAQENCKLQTN
jgi:hypothetical protein